MRARLAAPVCRIDRRLTILKFGGSVLRYEGDLTLAAHDIYREVRRGRRVLAVVSAFAGATDFLFERAVRVGTTSIGEPDPRGVAELLATGETTSAALLALVLARAGIPATLLDARRAGLLTRGPVLDAQPRALDVGMVRRALRRRPVAILPGFVGHDPEGGTTLLGRGGSDLTAIFAAAALRAGRCILVKDVGGVYETDPRHAGAEQPRCYETLGFSDALGLGGRVLQERALRLAARHGVTVGVAGPGGPALTRIGPGRTRTRESLERPRAFKVALLGLGTVGGGVYRELSAVGSRFEVIGVAVRDPGRPREEPVPPGLLTGDAGELLRRGPDIVIELFGGIDPARRILSLALDAGCDVVSANKALIARHGPELARIASARGARLLYSAAVGGSVPVLEAVERLARRGPIRSIRGVLNGTTNFVLDLIARGVDPMDAIARARQAGFAEDDPTLDLDGTDAAQKLVLILRHAFDWTVPLAAIARRGIDGISPERVRRAAAAGLSVRLLAAAVRDGTEVRASVRPALLSATHPLAATRNEENRVLIRPVRGRAVLLSGKGAGRWPTAESVLGDLFDLARTRAARGTGARATALAEEGA